MNVLALGALGAQAPSFRVRTRVPGAELARHGVAMRHLPLFSVEQDRRFHTAGARERARTLLAARAALSRTLASDGDADVALIQRQVDLLPSLRLERRAMAGRRLVLDVDDAIWLDRSPDAGGHRLAALKGTSRKVRWLAAHADAVLAGNELLAEWLSAHSDRVHVVPSLVEHRHIPVREHRQAATVVLGWLGSPTTAPSLDRLAEPLRRFAAAMPDRRVELLIVGGRAADVPGVSVRSEAWSVERERAFLEEVDIGLMPLPDTSWTRGKCSYKALQYMAAGIPVVADDVGVSATVIGHEEGGLIAGDADDWVQHLHTLASDATLRTRLGRTGRDRVAERFSVERWAPRMAAILHGRSAAAS